MHTEFQLPHITGRTTEEQLAQVIGYLRQTALLLQELPLQPPQVTEAVSRQLRSHTFSELTVRNGLRLDGGLNGIVMKVKNLKDTNLITLHSRFSQWKAESTEKQSFFLLGSSYGCLQVTGAGECSFSGSSGVSVTGAEGGIVKITLPQPVKEQFMLLSTGQFS